MITENQRHWFLAPCGLDCGSCSIHLRTDDELSYWVQRNVDPGKIRCDGCRSDRHKHHWSPDCGILQCCVYERRLEFCDQCTDFPCQALTDWGKEFKHHAEAVARLKEMKKMGVEQWLREQGGGG